MPYYERAELNPRYSENLTCAKDNCDKQNKVNRANAIFECFFCKKCFHPSCKNIFGLHIKTNAENPNWTCSDECRRNINLQEPPAGELKDESSRWKKMDKHMECFAAEFVHLKKMMGELIDSQQFMSDKFDNIKKEFDAIVLENHRLDNDLNILKAENKELTYRVNVLESVSDNVNQQNNKTNAIVAGLPNCECSASDVVIKIFDALQCTNYNDVGSAEYLPNKSFNRSTPPQIIDHKILIKFKSCEGKDLLLDKKRKRKNLAAGEIGFQSEKDKDRPIFLREHLTTYQKQLYHAAQQLKNNLKFKYMWVKNGAILLREKESAKVYQINSRNDINKLHGIFRNTDEEVHK